MTNLAAIRDAIRQLHGCDSEHLQSVPVTETFDGKVVWEGMVEIFNLQGHAKAQRCYAWSYRKDDGSERFVAVLEMPPIDSAQKAVRAAIVAETKKKN